MGLGAVYGRTAATPVPFRAYYASVRSKKPIFSTLGLIIHPVLITLGMGDLEDFSNFSGRLRRELDKIEQHRDADRDYVKRYIRTKDGTVTDGSLALYLQNLRMTSERLGHPIVELTEERLEDHVYELRHSPEYGQGDDPGLSQGSIRNVEFAVRDLLKTVDVGADWAEDYELTPPKKKKVRPEDMLVAEDIKALRDGANNYRDIALIEFLADTGARLSLAGSLRVRDVDLDGDRATYTPNPNASGLKGAAIQAYPLIDAKATLRNYLRSTHPRPDEDDVALFHKIPGHGNEFENDDGAIRPNTIQQQIDKAAESGVEKPVNPHNFRHSAITRMRREGYDRKEVEHRVHWIIDSDMWRIYEHISGEQHNETIWETAGVCEPDETGPDAQRFPCGNCTEPIAPHHDYCPKCGAPASRKARTLKRSAIGSLSKSMVQVDDASRREIHALLTDRLDADASSLGDHESPPSSVDSRTR